MPIPSTRAELVQLVETSWGKLDAELEGAGPDAGALPCVGEWSVADLLAVRLWWTESVVSWIEAGRRGEPLDLPAPGYRWSETPRLNADLVRAARRRSWRALRKGLEEGVRRVLATIEALDDEELLAPHAFPWAGKWPVARWISLNTARQYTTARTYVRRARRAASKG